MENAIIISATSDTGKESAEILSQNNYVVGLPEFIVTLPVKQSVGGNG